jgi:extracellular elastinolytic metalloproteinase
VIVRRGGCSFTMKVREIEHAGGKLGIIVDEVDNEAMDAIIMVDDGTGNGIRIPSVMINKKEGEIILEYIKMASELEKK